VGWIEYVNDPFDTASHIPNRRITDLKQFQKYVDGWTPPHAADS
jgi:hypothetical protein